MRTRRKSLLILKRLFIENGLWSRVIKVLSHFSCLFVLSVFSTIQSFLPFFFPLSLFVVFPLQQQSQLNTKANVNTGGRTHRGHLWQSSRATRRVSCRAPASSLIIPFQRTSNQRGSGKHSFHRRLYALHCHGGIVAALFFAFNKVATGSTMA